MPRDMASTPSALTDLSEAIDRYGHPGALFSLTPHPEGFLIECANPTHLNRIADTVQQFGYGASWRGIKDGFIATRVGLFE